MNGKPNRHYEALLSRFNRRFGSVIDKMSRRLGLNMRRYSFRLILLLLSMILVYPLMRLIVAFARGTNLDSAAQIWGGIATAIIFVIVAISMFFYEKLND